MPDLDLENVTAEEIASFLRRILAEAVAQRASEAGGEASEFDPEDFVVTGEGLEWMIRFQHGTAYLLHPGDGQIWRGVEVIPENGTIQSYFELTWDELPVFLADPATVSWEEMPEEEVVVDVE